MYRIVNMGAFGLGQDAPATDPTPVTYGCPWTPPSGPGGEAAFPVVTDPTLNCMRDARGNTICSDGSHYPPGCTKTPPEEFFTPGITPDVTTNGRIEGQIPPPKGGGSAPAGSSVPSSSPALMVGAGALGASLLAAGAYFLFVK